MPGDGGLPAGRPTDYQRRFILRIILPTLLATVGFIITIFCVFIPAVYQGQLQRKREMIRELSYSICSILGNYDADVQAGRLSLAEAQLRAAKRISALRYGPEQKDYFWINDMEPRMIMHPYRPDLDGTDLNSFLDVKGQQIFVELRDVARDQGEGYVDYFWQWKDNPERVVPKESFVKLFKPWGWVIGTGIYLEDVRLEIKRLTGYLTLISSILTVCIVLLLAFITWESLRSEASRLRLVEDLKESNAKYAALAQATTEGTLMLLAGQCVHANRTMAGMLGYSEEELARLDVNAIFPLAGPDAGGALANVEAHLKGEAAPASFEGQLVSRDGGLLNVLINVTQIDFAGNHGIILGARDITFSHQLAEELGASRARYETLAEQIDLGIFRLAANQQLTILEVNRAARRIFGLDKSELPPTKGLIDLLMDEDSERHLVQALQTGAGLRNHILTIKRPGGRPALASISLLLARERDAPQYYDGIVEDLTEQKQQVSEREILLQEFQCALLFLNEPLRNAVRPLISCEMHTPILQAAQLMSRVGATALALSDGEAGPVLGIVTDSDLRSRVLAAAAPLDAPVLSIMSAPITALPDTTPVFEAILVMQQHGLDHLAVRDEAGKVISIVRHADLVQLHSYSSAVIASKIQRAQAVEGVAAARAQLPQLVGSLLEAGARPRNICRIMSQMSGAVTERLLELACQELGPAPCRFCVVALGSEGRGEQSFTTDQDNALIIDDVAVVDPVRHNEYFAQLTGLLCNWLDRAGYHRCPGEIMASNPRWQRPLAGWQRRFSDWIAKATPQDLLEYNVFFDMRSVAGDRSLLSDLLLTIQPVIDSQPQFITHLAHSALLYKPLRAASVEGQAEGHGLPAGLLDLKCPMLQVVNFARVYAWQHRVRETNTFDRLRRLAELEVLPAEFYADLLQAYSTMMELRLLRQVQAASVGRPPANTIDPAGLSQVEHSMLFRALAIVAPLREKIAHDFPGGS
jgi:PAS domain S-box-containing protein